MSAISHQTPATRHQTPAKATGWDVVWTTHAARRMIQRGFDPAEVLNMVSLLCNSGVLSKERPTPIIRGKLKVVAKEIAPKGNLRCVLIITTTHAKKGTSIPRHKRNQSRHQQKRASRRKP